jgi:TldD protein
MRIKQKFKLKASITLILLSVITGYVKSQDKLADILQNEALREYDILKKQDVPAYYISYRVDEITQKSLSSSFGALVGASQNFTRVLTVSVRVGSVDMDNFHPLRGNYSDLQTETDFPLTNDEHAIKQMLWSATNDAYQQAVNNFTIVKGNVAIKAEEEDKSPDFILSEPNVYEDAPIDFSLQKFDSLQWIKQLNKYSAKFLEDKAIFMGTSVFRQLCVRKYFISSHGDKIAQNQTSNFIYFSGIIKAADGMELPLSKSYFATTPSKFPVDEIMSNDAEILVQNLIMLKNAPVAEPFTGPALLSSEASGVFFHEIFGHRVEGQRMRNENDAQTFKKKVNEPVLPLAFKVISNPNLKEYFGTELNGYYQYDDEGSKSKFVNLVDSGKLKDFLMSRTPIEGFLYSNGHGRAQAGLQPTARQSNLIVTTMQPYTTEQLRAELIKLIKEQKKEYGYYFKDVTGGFTQTSRINPNAFNVTPTLVYRVYADGRPDELVRGVNLIGTPLSMFSQIDKGGDKPGVFNGTCGAESGGVPVSACSPMILVKVVETQKKQKSQERAFILPRPDENK